MKPIETVNSIEQYLCEKATLNYTPINAILELTPLCNMNCDMCFVRLSPDELSKQGRLRSLDEWISLAESLKKAGTLFILLTGGEPLLYPDFRELYIYLIQSGFIVTINTNGTLLNDDWADFFLQYRPRRINITLYGKDEESYNKLCHYPTGYSKALNALSLLKERKIDVKLNGSITNINMQDIDSLIDIADKYHVKWKIDTYMYPATRERTRDFNHSVRLSPDIAAKIRVELLYRQLGRDAFCKMAEEYLDNIIAPTVQEENLSIFSCRAGRSSLVINWNGEMRPCIMLSTPSLSVFKLGFDIAWGQMNRLVEEIQPSSKCCTCSFRKVCNTCMACAILESGEYNGIPEYMCQYIQKTVYYMKEKLREYGITSVK